MFHPLAFFIGLRYTRAKRRNGFISFISLASILGIALGVTVLITVMSVMNGFDEEIHKEIFKNAQQVTITSTDEGITDWQKLSKIASQTSGVIAVAPYVSGQAMLNHNGQVNGVMIFGVEPELERNVSAIPESMVSGSLDSLKSGTFNVVLGQKLAAILGVSVGDKIMVITPKANMTLVGIIPQMKRFTVSGIFHVSEGFGYDSGAIFINMNDAEKLLQLHGMASGLRLRVNNLYAAPGVARDLVKVLSDDYLVRDWTQDYDSYFKAIRMEKTTMFVVLLFIIAVATFNLVSSLVMTVNDKRADIAILRTLGATPKMILRIFMVQGTIIGFTGTLLGLIGGILLALNAPAIVSGIEHLFGVNFISSAVYFISYLPSKLEFSDVIHIGIISLLMSLVATIYPAWRAAKTQPAEALRYE